MLKAVSNLSKSNPLLFGLILAVCSAILIVVSWPESSFNSIYLFVFIPVILGVFVQDKVWKAFLVYFLFHTLFLFGTHFNMFVLEGSERIGQMTMGLFVVPIFWTIPVAFSAWVGIRFRKWQGLLVLPFMLTFQEVIQFHWDLDFVWSHIGYGASDSSVLSWVYGVVGVEGMTFFLLCIAASFVYVYQCADRRKYVFWLVGFALVLVVQFIPDSRRKGKKKYHVAFFQPSATDLKNVENDLMAQLDFLKTSTAQQGLDSCDLLICPEGYFSEHKNRPLFVNTIHEQPVIQGLKELARQYNTAILSGAKVVELFKTNTAPSVTAKYQEDGFYYEVYNASIFVTPEGKVQWNAKKKLVAFTEKVPLMNFLIWVSSSSDWFELPKMYGVNEKYNVYKHKGMAIAPVICFEALFPNEASQFVKKKSNLIVVLANEWSNDLSVLNRQRRFTSVLSKSFGNTSIFASSPGNSSIEYGYSSKPIIDNNVLSYSSFEIQLEKSTYSRNNDFFRRCWIVLGLLITIFFVVKSILTKS